ncbi:GyrI-like domain-containing protein [Aureispira anguillae]|uniref:Effector binding domain-containing protein n=1 Tax=Aureispira anguillae TaxID=2864201 RepID=A0A916DWB8_9BACT|nr:effector binding domain-containing protein [Aureispira anguillae]BDS15306.1 effector binding domain-containing protein [Aureispira anguillae]
MKKIKWRSILALLLIITIIYFNWTWGWSIVFLLWLIPDLLTGVTFLMEPIERKENPILYWAILLVWGVLSVLLLLDEFAPQTLPKGWSSADTDLYISQQDGSYTIDYKKHLEEKDTLFYKSHISNGFNVVGISTLTTFKNNEVDYTLKELWEAFGQEDISAVIPDIIDDKIYVIQSDFDKEKAGYFTLTIGYKTASLNTIYEGLNGVSVKPSKYAVVEMTEQPVEQLGFVWEKIALSDLPATNLNNVEVYHYDFENKQTTKIDVWVAVPTKKEDFKPIESSLVSMPKDSLGDTSTVVKAQKLKTPYQAPKDRLSKEEPIKTQVIYPTQKQNSFTIVGLQDRTKHGDEKAMNQCIGALWEAFFQKNYAKHIYDIIDYDKIYVSYTNYTEEEVTITLGYRTKSGTEFNRKKNLKSSLIPTNDYYHLEIDGASTDYSGKDWAVLDEVMAYRAATSADFEVYTFDEKYNITKAYLWIGKN